jgi:hypothetical protein
MAFGANRLEGGLTDGRLIRRENAVARRRLLRVGNGNPERR